MRKEVTRHRTNGIVHLGFVFIDRNVFVGAKNRLIIAFTYDAGTNSAVDNASPFTLSFSIDSST